MIVFKLMYENTGIRIYCHYVCLRYGQWLNCTFVRTFTVYKGQRRAYIVVCY